MKDPKFGYIWIWFILYYYAIQVYMFVLEKWFPTKFRKFIKRK